jgi:hypothetical protein
MITVVIMMTTFAASPALAAAPGYGCFGADRANLREADVREEEPPLPILQVNFQPGRNSRSKTALDCQI